MSHNLMLLSSIEGQDTAPPLSQGVIPQTIPGKEKVGAVYATTAAGIKEQGLSPQDNSDRALMEAVKSGDIKAIRGILGRFSPALQLKTIISQNISGNVIWVEAVQGGNTEVITALLKDLSPSVRLVLIGTAVLLAKNEAVLKVLLKDLSQDDIQKILSKQNQEGDTVLMRVIRGGNPEIISAVLKSLSPANRMEAFRVGDREGTTALRVLIGANRALEIGELFEDLTEDEQMEVLAMPIDRAGNTALIVAAILGYTETLTALLESLPRHKQQLAVAMKGHGIMSNYTPLDGCLHRSSNEEVMKLLISLEAPCITDSPLSESAKDCLLHIRFGLRNNPEEITPPHVVFQTLSDSLHPFIQGRNDPELLEIEAAFLNTTAYQFLPARTVAERILKGESVVIPTGWATHATAVVFSKGLIMKCNRGSRPKDTDCGIEVFAPSSSLTLDELTDAIQMLRQRTSSSDDFYKKLDTKLHLEKVTLEEFQKPFVDRQEQKTGNCMFASPKTAFAALLFAHYSDTQERLGYAFVLYKEFTAFDRSKAKKENPEWVAKHPEATLKTSQAESRAKRYSDTLKHHLVH